MNKKIHYTKPSITDLEVEYVKDAARNGWGERCYEYIHRFETLFKEYVGSKYAIATSSCTGALHMGLAAIGVGNGDEVILADTNWIATAAPIVYLGARPVFVDILKDTWCLNHKLVEKSITQNTKAIIAVHLYGNLCEMNELLAIGEKYGIPVIEDSAEAIGSIYKGKRAGSIGKFGVFSFHGTKTLTTGEGGMFVTNDKAIFEKVLTLSNHGRSRQQTKQFWADMIGFKYKMSNIQAAIGCAQLERIDELIHDKKRIFLEYKNQLTKLPITLNPEKPGTTNGYWMPNIVIADGVNFDKIKLFDNFKKANIDARVFFYPLSSMTMFRGNSANTNSKNISERSANLPSYYGMSDTEIEQVVEIVNDHLSS